MLVFEHELVSGDRGMTWDRDRVSAFLDLVMESPGCSVLVLGGELLRQRRAFGLPKGVGYQCFELSQTNATNVLKACTSHGHLSVFFLPLEAHNLRHRFLNLGFYGPPTSVRLGTEDSTDPMDVETYRSLELFLASTIAKGINEMLGFTHDAEQFYEIHPSFD